jgi:hypothetical protein
MTNRLSFPRAWISWIFPMHRVMVLLFVPVLSGCAGPAQPGSIKPDHDIRGELLDILAHVGSSASQSPQIARLHEKHNIVPILIDIAKDKVVSWYRALRKRPHYEEAASDQSIRQWTWDKVFTLFDKLADERGYRFQIQAYQDLSEPYIVRMNALRHFWNANLPEVRDLFAHILERHVRSKAYSADGLLVLQYVRQSTRFRPNRLWDARMKKAVEDYLVFNKEYRTANPSIGDPDAVDNEIQLVRQAIEKLDRPE